MFDIYRSDALSHDTCNDIDDAALRQSFSLSKLRLMNLLSNQQCKCNGKCK